MFRLGEVVSRRRASTDARELRACLVDPQRCPEALESRERGLEGLAGRGALLRAPLTSTECEQRSRSLERVEILSGLSAGDRVVISGSDNFKGADRVLIAD